MPPTLETDRTELTSLLTRQAYRLRNDAMAVLGLAHTHFHASEVEQEQLAWLAESIERNARLLDLVGERLCQGCRFLKVAERVSVEGRATANPSTPRPRRRRARGVPNASR